MFFLVTGGSGFLASHIVDQLISDGHRVRVTVRSLTSHAAPFLRGVEVVVADLMSPNGWKEAILGVDVVVHVASPFKLQFSDGKKELIDPAIQGTKHVLEACLKSPTLKRVVLTSSIFAISPENLTVGNPPEYSASGWTEEAWNDQTDEKLRHGKQKYY